MSAVMVEVTSLTSEGNAAVDTDRSEATEGGAVVPS